MKRLMIIMIVLVCAGCGANVDEQIQKLKLEMEDMKKTDESLKNDYKRDLVAAQQNLQSDYNNKIETIKKDLDTQKDVHQKNMKEVNISLIDIQKDFYQNRRLTEENTRRIYIIEGFLFNKGGAVEERSEGNIISLKGSDVIIDLGSKHGIKAGNILVVYKNNSPNEKLATIRVLVVETEQSNGEIVEKSAIVAKGDVVRLK